MQITCPKCGTVVDSSKKFCRKCGFPIHTLMQEQNTENAQQTQNQEDISSQSSAYGQSNMQGQPNAYGQPNMQGQPNAYGQPNMAGQSNAYGQPNMAGQSNTYGQPNMAGQSNTYGQPNMPGQPNTYGQPNMAGQPNAYGQPNMAGQPNTYGQPNMYGQSQMQYGNVLPKKKGSPIVVVGAAIAVLAVLGAGAFFAIRLLPGMFKDSKTLFAENTVSVTRNFSEEFTDFGSKPIEAMVHLGMDDTRDSHTTTKITTIESDASGKDQEYSLEQSYSYDSGSGDSAYTLSVNMGDTSLGTGGVYYNGNEFIYSPANTTSPMVRYELDESAAKSLGAYQAIDRYTLMLKGMSSENEVDWDRQLEDFLEVSLAGIEKEEFEKSREDYTVFGKTQKCDTVSVTVSGQEAIDLMEGMTKLITVGISNGDDIDMNDVFGENETDDSISLTATTYSYKNSPVGVVISYTKDSESYSINLSGYSNGKEKQTILDVPSEKGKGFYYEDGVYSIDSGYEVLNKINFGEFSIVVDETGKINGLDRDLSGSFTIKTGKKTGKIHLEEDSFTGSISQVITDGKGQFVTELQTKEGYAKITTNYERGKLQEDKINAPVFLSESGIDCGSDLDMLKETIHAKMLGDKGKTGSGFANMGNSNSVVRLGYIISLMVRNR
ncbi:zinc ribbon domain-containing protein [Oribacterium sp. WCC10]|uniref:zinc ribbon domain-containing protein n=1 Tax=Oribacterium sp. WCC10 TaxID=1855343 RepID=UPI0008E6AF0F|nr:zinc ribbon domain-containing protein [Oribacterium sp. WCC10]SFG73294.1 zinc-ribbon domain-containing protein [Oribacterium sp. WCC10]